MLDANAFNFEAMKEAIGADPFAQDAGNKYGKDERFYTLSKDKDGNGAAIIRFMPDSERGMIQKLFSINTTIVKNGKKRFVSEYSPSSIGLPDPFQEKWQELWNAGLKDDAKIYGRGVRFITNIKVLKDPACPENEGKFFLYAMSGKMKDKIQSAIDPSEQDRALGATPKELFNPIRGNSFKLVARKGANGQINYDSSEVIADVTGIYDSVETALDDIKTNSHKLSDLLKPESFMTYDELTKKMSWVNFTDTEVIAPASQTLTAEAATPAPAVAEVQPAVTPAPAVAEVQPAVTPAPTPAPSGSSSLDDLLNGLV